MLAFKLMQIFRSTTLKKVAVGFAFILIAFSASPLTTNAQATSTAPNTSAGTTTPTGNAASPSETPVPAQDGGGCSLTHPTTWGDCVVKAVATVALTIANFLLATAGTLLNWVVVKAVFQFGSLIGNSPGVLIAWGVLRDIGNMVLLFGFIFMGIATILDLHTFSARKALPSLLIFAILMNFSLFAAEAIIDTSNALSSTLYAQANTDPCNGITGTVTTGGQTDEDCAVNYGIAGHIMQSTGLSSIFEANSSSLTTESVTYVILALFATVGAVVLFAAAIMLAVRLIVLSFLMVVSPIGFAGMAIPPLRGFARDWWRRLIGESFFAPVLFLLIFISLKITDTFAATDTRGSLAAAVQQPGASAMGIVMIFTIVIGFLIASLIVARKMSASGAGFAVKTAGTLTYGTMGYVGRNTAGWGFNKANDRIRSSSFGQTSFGRRVAMITEKGAKGSYDFRATGAGSALSKRIGDMGKPAKDGYVGQVKRTAEGYTKYSGTLKQTADARKQEEQLKKKKDVITESRRMEETRWNKEKDEKEAEISELKKGIASREKERDTQSERLNAAIASGDQEAYRRESTAMDSLMNSHQTLDAEANEKLQTMQSSLEEGKKQHDTFMQGFSDELKKVDTQIKGDIDKGIAGVDANSSTRQYAINLNRGRGNQFRYKGASRDKAVDTIKKDLKKSKSEKAIEALKHSIDAGNKHDDTDHKLDDIKKALDEEKAHDHDADHGHGGDSHGH